jgi:hypothetical protein
VITIPPKEAASKNGFVSNAIFLAILIPFANLSNVEIGSENSIHNKLSNLVI